LATHNPKVAGSNPAPAIGRACKSLAFLLLRFCTEMGV
jgi:hypothetical protein